jgi:hypothetical protein
MYVSGNYIYVDPECALHITNKVHGTDKDSFRGEAAQQRLEEFQEYKSNNG